MRGALARTPPPPSHQFCGYTDPPLSLNVPLTHPLFQGWDASGGPCVPPQPSPDLGLGPELPAAWPGPDRRSPPHALPASAR